MTGAARSQLPSCSLRMWLISGGLVRIILPVGTVLVGTNKTQLLVL